MPTYRLDLIETLARQMAFAPVEVRVAQLAAAEDLLYDLDAACSYPQDFVTFRITGYHPRGGVPGDLLTGLALQHDLGVLIERVSEGLDLRVDQTAEPVLSIDDVTERFNVTSKTIQRWRRKGLVSRRFTFGDGKRRVGFLLSSIERFVARHSEAVERNANLTQVSGDETAAIVRHARRLATRGRCSVSEITRRLARRFDRSPLTILHTVRKHDQLRPDEAVFALAAPEVSPAKRLKVVRAARRGVALRVLARKARLSRASVYRLVMDDRVERLTRRKVRFHDDELYHQPHAGDVVDEIVRSGDLAAPSRDAVRIPKGLPAYLADLYRTPLLSPQQERALFLKFNFHKYGFVAARRQFDPERARKRELERLERHQRLANVVKNRIVQANLRLVVSVARKHVSPVAGGFGAGRSGAANPSLMDLVSEGNLILMRAVESFDVHKNVRFSTYGTFALMKGFARLVPELRNAGTINGTGRGVHLDAIGELVDRSHAAHQARLANVDEVSHLLRLLSPAERRVITMHYGLDGGLDAATRAGEERCTLDELGRRLGLSKHRVRQLEQVALGKLRSALGVATTPAARV